MVSKLCLNQVLFSLLCIWLLSGPIRLSAQITVAEEPAIIEMMEEFKRRNASETTMRAWRIQILTTNDRREMEQGLQKFNMLYPDMDYAWEHNPPYYQVRIGAYEIKEDLEALLLQIKRDFPAAIPVQDQMKKTEILKF